MVNHTSGCGHGPIFIGGLSHSGKTPLRLMLSSHSNVALSRRTYMWQRYYGRFGDLGNAANFDRCLGTMLAHPAIQALSPNAGRIRRDFAQGPATYGHLFAIIHNHFASAHGKQRWGAQIGLIEEYADVIFADYPGARMIHMMCDPRRRRRMVVGSRIGKTGWETAKWLHSAHLARRNQARYADCYMILNCESLSARPEATLRRICDFLGEAYEPAMLSMEAAIRFGGTVSTIGPEPKQAFSDRDLSPASRPLSRRDLAFTQVYAGQQITDFGYQIELVRLSLKEQLLFNVLDRPANLASLVAWRTIKSFKKPA